jgi:biotin carboxylase
MAADPTPAGSPASARVLVVGTTPDYVELILRRHPARAVFLTELRFRASAKEAPPPVGDELTADLLRPPAEILDLLRGHLGRRGMRLEGITCFDCESLALAAYLARALGLPYASAPAVAAARDKFACKQLWREAGLPAPAAELVGDADQACALLERLQRGRSSPGASGAGAGGRDARGADASGAGALVLKPLTGSGSELVFHCRTAEEVRCAIGALRTRLAHHHDVRMYAPLETARGRLDPREVFVAEEFVRGAEYSCDFVLDRGRVELIRMARKILLPAPPVGTTLAYLLPARLPAGIRREAFHRQVGAAATSLGLTRAMVMLDFIVRGREAVMLEMTPRPGGDCLPPLILASSGLDMLGAALDFAAGRDLVIPPPRRWEPLVGLRLFARRAGTITRLDPRPLAADPRVRAVHLTREAGHRVVLPPENYDSRILGYAIFAPANWRRVAAESRELGQRLELEMRP